MKLLCAKGADLDMKDNVSIVHSNLITHLMVGLILVVDPNIYIVVPVVVTEVIVVVVVVVMVLVVVVVVVVLVVIVC